MEPDRLIFDEAEQDRQIRAREHYQHIGTDAFYVRCAWCGDLMPYGSQGGRALYELWDAWNGEYLHPGACVDAVRWAESN